MSDGTTAGSADNSILGITSSGPPALLGFRGLNFLDIDSSEIEMVEIVCVSVGSFPVSTGGQTVFLERLVAYCSKEGIYQICLLVFTYNESIIFPSYWANLGSPLWIRCFGEYFPVRSRGIRRIDLFAEKAGFRKKALALY